MKKHILNGEKSKICIYRYSVPDPCGIYKWIELREEVKVEDIWELPELESEAMRRTSRERLENNKNNQKETLGLNPILTFREHLEKELAKDTGKKIK